MSAPETLESLRWHLRNMADKATDQIDADRLSRAADMIRADLPPTLEAALALPEVAALVEAAKRYIGHATCGDIGAMEDEYALRAALDAIAKR